MKLNFENETTEVKREYTNNLKKEEVTSDNTRGGIIYIGIND